MSSTPKAKTNFDKVEHILSSLKNGANRHKLAYELGYSNPKSLDIYMRRKGFYYNTDIKNYSPLNTDQIKGANDFTEKKRISNILILFSEDNPDPKKIAQLTGFKDHIELADYMKSHSFVWNDKFGNYIKNNSHEVTDISLQDGELFSISDFYIYLPLIRKLYENRENLLKLISNKSNEDSPTIVLTSNSNDCITIDISTSTLELLLRHASSNGIEISRIIEASIIEHLKNYR